MMMQDQNITDDQGEILRLIAKVKTTSHGDRSIKPIDTDSTTIEVLVFDSIMTAMGSQFGHVAIDIDGTIHSRAHSKYARIVDGAGYRRSNMTLRNFEGLVLRVLVGKSKVENKLKGRVEIDAPYGIVNNSCSTNIADVLETIGILAHDPQFKLGPNQPISYLQKKFGSSFLVQNEWSDGFTTLNHHEVRKNVNLDSSSDLGNRLSLSNVHKSPALPRSVPLGKSGNHEVGGAWVFRFRSL